jgi:hypothetical protein
MHRASHHLRKQHAQRSAPALQEAERLAGHESRCADRQIAGLTWAEGNSVYPFAAVLQVNGAARSLSTIAASAVKCRRLLFTRVIGKPFRPFWK